MKIRIASNLVVGGFCAVALSLGAVSMAFADTHHNCFCGPVDDCNGIPITASTYCTYGFWCTCEVLWSDTEPPCILGLIAKCLAKKS